MTSARRPGVAGRRGSRWSLLALLATAALLLAACGQGLPQNSLEPAGEPAQRIDTLFRVVFWIAAVIFFLVEGALVYALVRFRRRPGRETPVQVHGNTRLEVLWTIIPALLLAGVAVPTVTTIFSLSRAPAAEERLDVEVIGHQWWWEFRYPEQNIVTGNEMHIPVGRPVHLTLRSDELQGGLAGFTEEEEPKPIVQNAIPVIHSFWVPRLAGKQDLVPGRTHTLTMEAGRPGIYGGQCAEFCGLSHANMRLRVVADEPKEFEAWVSGQQAAAAEPEEGTLEAEGAEVFQQFQGATAAGSCAACHTLDPTVGETVGPNLAHFASRDTFAAGLFDRNEQDLTRWLDNPRRMKPGVVMPDYTLTEDQIEALVAYLQTLK